MKVELLIILITVFFIANVYTDGKYVKLLKSWKKYYQMAGIGFVGLSTYLFMKKNPSQSKSLLTHANGIIKYMPIDKESSDILTPFLNMSQGNNNNNNMSYQENVLLNSGRVNNMNPNTNTNGQQKPTKRSVSETKKKYVASQQGWKCGDCKKQLPAWFEVHHATSLENGGSNHIDNLVALCRDCHGKATAFENL